MENTIYLVQHAQTEIDKTKPVSQWSLTTAGRLQAEQLCKEFSRPDIIVSSTEKKAIDTARPLARKFNLVIDKYKALNELNRDKSGYLSKEKFDFLVKYALKNPDKSKLRWETASHALGRYADKIQEIDVAYQKKKIVIFSHSLVISMYFAQQLGELHRVYERMLKTSFCSYGVIRNKVIKDIVL